MTELMRNCMPEVKDSSTRLIWALCMHSCDTDKGVGISSAYIPGLYKNPPSYYHKSKKGVCRSALLSAIVALYSILQKILTPHETDQGPVSIESRIVLVTRSSYLLKNHTNLIYKNCGYNAQGKPIKNRSLWLKFSRLLDTCFEHNICFSMVPEVSDDKVCIGQYKKFKSKCRNTFNSPRYKTSYNPNYECKETP